jgi:hypothetical protein
VDGFLLACVFLSLALHVNGDGIYIYGHVGREVKFCFHGNGPMLGRGTLSPPGNPKVTADNINFIGFEVLTAVTMKNYHLLGYNAV